MNGQAQAAALLIAERVLIKLGWGFTAVDVGKTARQILDAMNPPSKEPS